MSSVTITIVIIVLLAGLVCFAFVSQTIEKNRKQKQRLLAALKMRARSFKYVLSGFPPDFLTPDLTILVHRCLIDVCEQLSRLEPGERQYIDELQLYSQQMEQVQKKTKIQRPKPLENPQQVKEVKSHLEDVNKFVFQLVKRGTLNPAQAQAYSKQIRQLTLQMTIDNYVLNAKQAQGSDKKRLAVHYYGLAHKLLLRANTEGGFSKQIAQLNQVLEGLNEALREEEPNYQETDAQLEEKAMAEKAWDTLEEGNTWKKKSVYDE